MTAVIAAIVTVRRMADHAPNDVRAPLRSVSPWEKPDWITAATGSRMNRPRYSRAIPRSERRPRAAPGLSRARPAARGGGLSVCVAIYPFAALKALVNAPLGPNTVVLSS